MTEKLDDIDLKIAKRELWTALANAATAGAILAAFALVLFGFARDLPDVSAWTLPEAVFWGMMWIAAAIAVSRN